MFGQRVEAVLAFHGEGAKEEVAKKDDSGHNAVHLAAETGDLDIVKLVLSKCEGNTQQLAATKNGELPLHCALSGSNTPCTLELAQFLVDMDPKAANKCDNDGKFPLHLAAEHCNAEILALMVSVCSGDVKKLADADSKFPLHYVCDNESNSTLAKLDALLAFHPDAARHTDEDGRSLAHIAAVSCELQVLEKCISVCGDLAMTADQDGKFLLHTALANKQSSEKLNFILALQPSAAHEKTNDGESPSHLAAEHGASLPTLRSLVSASSENSRQVTNNGSTLLHCYLDSAQNNSLGVVQFLLDFDAAAASTPDKEDRTPAHLAAAHSNLEVLEVVLGIT